jgi:biopolymer transport protein ExbB/TolQ
MKTILDMVNENVKSEPELSFTRLDIEKRLGVPSGRYTNSGPLLPPLGGMIITVFFYTLLSYCPESFYKDMFTKRGVVQYVIVFFSAWSLLILFVKHFKIRLQCRALSLKILPINDPGFVLTPASSVQILENLYRTVDDPKQFLLTKRIQNALSNLRNMGRIGDVDEVLQSHAENDEEVVDSSYTMIRGLIWAIPVLGFIGTVQGLSMALGSFWGVIANSQQIDQLRGALQNVTGGLSTAFETTLVGLVAALCIHLLMITVKRREEQFLDDCRDYCQQYIVSRLRLIASDRKE